MTESAAKTPYVAAMQHEGALLMRISIDY
jgi:hypothetical protein